MVLQDADLLTGEQKVGDLISAGIANVLAPLVIPQEKGREVRDELQDGGVVGRLTVKNGLGSEADDDRGGCLRNAPDDIGALGVSREVLDGVKLRDAYHEPSEFRLNFGYA